MRLKQKYFIPFMVVVAVFAAVAIVISSFNFKEKQQELFKRSIAKSDSLNRMKIPKLEGDRKPITLNDFTGREILVLFWATWSDKSASMMEEIQAFQNERDSMAVIAAVVMDAEESIPEVKQYPDFIYADGTRIFNDLKVPGIPSYMLFNKRGGVIHAHIGYQKSAGYDTLKTYLK